MDTTNAPVCLLHSVFRLWNCFPYQLHRHILPCFTGHSVWYDVGSHLYLHFCDFAADTRRNNCGSQSERSTRPPMQSECRAQTDSREEMVHGTSCDHTPRRNPSLWVDLHRNVSTHSLCFAIRAKLTRYHTGTSFSRRSGRIRFITSTASCCWCSSFSSQSPSA